MDGDSVDSGSSTEAVDASRPRPRMSQWIWRPWYAKLWWGCAALYWSGKLGAWFSPDLDTVYTSAAAGYLNLAFYPFVPLIVLGVGYVGDWMDYYRWEWVSEPREELFPKRSVGGWRDPYSDPANPRSGPLWIGSSKKRAERLHHRNL